MEDTYILKGTGDESYEPRFTYHGFRYAQIEYDPRAAKLYNVTGRVVRSAVEPVGKFNYDKLFNSMLNRRSRLLCINYMISSAAIKRLRSLLPSVRKRIIGKDNL